MVEGHGRGHQPSRDALLTDRDDAGDGNFDLVEHYFWNPQCRNALRPQEMRPRFVLLHDHSAVMREPVHFDREPRCGAVEVQDIAPRRMLTAVFEAARALAQFAPEQAFRKRHLTAEFTRPLEGFAGSGDHLRFSEMPVDPARAPPPASLVPLPVSGR